MFTPGKWEERKCAYGWTDIYPSKCLTELPVASVRGHHPSTNEADARLIAASKDLHQAVIDLLPFAESVLGLKNPRIAEIRSTLDEIRGQK